jgi:hypothetical protein
MVWLLSFGQAAVLDEAVTWMYNNWLTVHKNTKDYKPNNYIRRDEIAKLLVNLITINEPRKVYINDPESCIFSDDIDETHLGLGDLVVESCRLWLFKGNTKKFSPKASITNAQIIAVVVRMMVWQQNEKWLPHRSDNYYKKANDLWLLKSVSMNDKNALATRWNVAVLLYNVQNVKSKSDACKLSDGLYDNHLQSKRPDNRSVVRQFYKYNNKLYYPLIIKYIDRNNWFQDIWDMYWTKSKYYFYSYDCSNQKTLDMNISVWTRLQIISAWEEYILLYWSDWTDSENRYVFLDTKNMQTYNITSLKNNSDIKEKVKNELKPIYQNIVKNTEGYNGIEFRSNKFVSVWYRTDGFSFEEVLNGAMSSIQILDIDKDLNANIALIVWDYSTNTKLENQNSTLSKLVLLWKINLLTQKITLK